jgi:hypothetical protein
MNSEFINYSIKLSIKKIQPKIIICSIRKILWRNNIRLSSKLTNAGTITWDLKWLQARCLKQW